MTGTTAEVNKIHEASRYAKGKQGKFYIFGRVETGLYSHAVFFITLKKIKFFVVDLESDCPHSQSFSTAKNLLNGNCHNFLCLPQLCFKVPDTKTDPHEKTFSFTSKDVNYKTTQQTKEEAFQQRNHKTNLTVL